MKKYITISAAFAAIAILASCEKDPIAKTDDRVPCRTEFQQRNLSGIGFTIMQPDNLEAIDLGLSVKWANMNIGAKMPTEFGSLYSWGEIYQKGVFSWENYEMNDFHADDKNRLYLTRYCFDLRGERQDLENGGINLDPNDDIARLVWGDDWRMPTEEEARELVEKCEWSYSHAMGLYLVKGPNGNVIRIAYQGVGFEDDIYKVAPTGYVGGVWTSTLSYKQSDKAYMLKLNGFDSGAFTVEVSEADRFLGSIIRPVFAK